MQNDRITPAEPAHVAAIRAENTAIVFPLAEGLAGRFVREFGRSKGVLRKLTVAQLRILIALCTWIKANNITTDGTPFVSKSQKSIRKRTGLGRAAVQRNLKALAARGLITLDLRGDGSTLPIYVLQFLGADDDDGTSSNTEARARQLRGEPDPEPNLFSGKEGGGIPGEAPGARATMPGGIPGEAPGARATMPGGIPGEAPGARATMPGGIPGEAPGARATMPGGIPGEAPGARATMPGGIPGEAPGARATMPGGIPGEAPGARATMPGGIPGEAPGARATMPGGIPGEAPGARAGSDTLYSVKVNDSDIETDNAIGLRKSAGTDIGSSVLAAPTSTRTLLAANAKAIAEKSTVHRELQETLEFDATAAWVISRQPWVTMERIRMVLAEFEVFSKGEVVNSPQAWFRHRLDDEHWIASEDAIALVRGRASQAATRKIEASESEFESRKQHVMSNLDDAALVKFVGEIISAGRVIGPVADRLRQQSVDQLRQNQMVRAWVLDRFGGAR